MFNTLYLLNYNNYYNRLVKQESSLNGYLNYDVATCAGINFNPNDGIATEQTVNIPDDVHPDYAVVIDDANNIVSRWFIVEMARVRGGQYNLTLRRDVIVDYYNVIINAPCFVEKATLSNNDPCIFNSENMTFNQIKKSEILLENKLKTPWLIAYLSRSHTNEDGTAQVYNHFSGTFKNEGESVANEIYASLSDYPLYNLRNRDLLIANNLAFGTRYRVSSVGNTVYTSSVNESGGSYSNVTYQSNPFPDDLPVAAEPINYPNATAVSNYKTLKAIYDTYNTVDSMGLKYNTLTNSYSYDSYLLMQGESNKIIKAGDKLYQVNVTLTTKVYQEDNYGLDGGLVINSALQLNTKAKELLTTPYLDTKNKTTQQVILMGNTFYHSYAHITIEEASISESNVQYNFGYDGTVTADAEYEIIATPFKDVTFTTGSGGQTFLHKGNYALQWFQSLANKYYSSGYCYDLQLVPYCPIDTKDIIDLVAANKVIYCQESDQDIKRALAFKLEKSSFSILNTSISLPLNPNYKIGSLTELYRITSPNGVGNFEFNPYKNKGFFGYEVDCTLKPISPYIKINPIFNTSGLYGGDYNDFRGLICGGDFSLSLTSNAWQTYANSNKYFQDVFDRQIENMEVTNSYQKINDIVSAYTGTVTGATSGAVTGAMAGGGVWGAVAGGLVGGAASGVAGAADVKINQLLRMEAIDYTKDQFGYQLQTIRARPDTLSRTTSFNINNKYFPYIEIFSCTDVEKEALENKIKYNGMTVMRIGRISDFLQSTPSYIKGQLIRLENLDDDFHVANTISGEINKGMFI